MVFAASRFDEKYYQPKAFKAIHGVLRSLLGWLLGSCGIASILVIERIGYDSTTHTAHQVYAPSTLP
jgi:hypothetical protein